MRILKLWIDRALNRAMAFEESGWEWSGMKPGWIYHRRDGQPETEKKVGYLTWAFMKAFRWGIGHHASESRKVRKPL